MRPGHPNPPTRWRRPTLKNAKSFLVKLITPHSACSLPDEKGHENKPATVCRESPPPAYDIATQAPLFATNTRVDSRRQFEERWGDPSAVRPKSRAHPTYTNSSSASLPHAETTGRSHQYSFAANNRPPSAEFETLGSSRTLRGRRSQQSSASRDHHAWSSERRPESTRKATRSRADYPILHQYHGERRLDRSRRGTSNQRDRELIAARKSLPILTKHGRTANHHNVPLC